MVTTDGPGSGPMAPDGTPMGRVPGGHGRFAALRSRNFAALWCAGIISNTGAQMQDVALIWLLVRRTNSALALGLLGLCFAGPMLLLPPLGGLLADRLDRVSLLKATQTLMTLLPLGLAAALATGNAPLWIFYAYTLAAAAVYAINAPAQRALTPVLAPRDALLSAVALQSAMWTGARLVGPAQGGLLQPALGAPWLFALNGLSTLAVLAALVGLRDVPRGAPAVVGGAPARGSGLRYAWGHRPVRAMLALIAALTLLQGAYMVLLPFFARGTWHAGAQGYGFLLSATGAGALIGTFGLAALGRLRRQGRVVTGGALLYGLAVLAVAHTPVYGGGVALLVLAGAAYASVNALLATRLQVVVPDHWRGRVMALQTIAYIPMDAIGSLITGGLAQAVGPAAALTGGAVALLLALPILARGLVAVGGADEEDR
jgi:MFS family permease